MRQSPFIALLVSGAVAAVGVAQPNESKDFEKNVSTFRASFRPTATASDEAKSTLALRPNVVNSAFLILENVQKDGAENAGMLVNKLYYVAVFEDKDGLKPIATSPRITMPKLDNKAKSSVVVPLTATRKAAPVDPKADPNAPKPGAMALPASLYVRVSDKPFAEGEKGVLIGQPIAMSIASPSEFVRFSSTQGRIESNRADFSVQVALNNDALANQYSRSPIRVKFNLRPDLNSHLGTTPNYDEASLEAELPFEKDATVKLFVAGLPMTSETATTIAFDVDGYARTAMYRAGNSNTFDRPESALFVRSDETLMVPGKPFKVTFEPFGRSGTTDWKIVRSRQDRTGGTIDDVLKKGTTLYDQTVAIASNDDGSLALTTTHADWTVSVASAGAAGTFEFRSEVGTTKSAPAKVIIDPSKPENVKLDDVADANRITGTEVILEATASDSLSGIGAVWFYRGDPPTADGKAAPGSASVKGVALNGGKYRAERAIALPDQKGDARLGVIAFNKVGLSASDEKTIPVRLPPQPKAGAAKKTTGNIIGFVKKGQLGQISLPVELIDSTGKTVLKTTTTAADGSFKFEDLAPGSYTVKSVKKADHNATGSASATVEAEKDSKVEIQIRRQP